MRRSSRAIVVGGGIVGAACAATLTDAGFAVIMIEGQTIGGGATAAGMGHLVLMDDSEAQFALTHYSLQLWSELWPTLPIASDPLICGTIWVATDEEELAEVRRKLDFYRARGVPAEELDPHGLRSLEPSLRPGLAGGLLIPGDRVVYSPAVAAWLVESARARGATVRVGTPVRALAGKQVILADGEPISGDLVINATGSDASKLTPGLDLRPRKGHLVITDRYPGFAHHQLVELGYLKSAHSVDQDSVAFNVQPRPTGQILIGSSRQYSGDDRAVDHQILGRMLRRAIAYLPGLSRLSAIRVWTGFRAATPDKLPLIGPWPAVDGLYLATGHEGLGITTSLATARLLVDHLLGRPTAIPLGPYRPARVCAGGGSHG